jgi:hypothetical protein
MLAELCDQALGVALLEDVLPELQCQWARNTKLESFTNLSDIRSDCIWLLLVYGLQVSEWYAMHAQHIRARR